MSGWLQRASDYLDDRWEWWGPVGEYDTLLSKATCFLKGHEPCPDQCNIPAHDFCLRCGKLMPGEAPHRNRVAQEQG